MSDLQWVDAVTQAAMIRDGEISATEAVQAAIDRIEALDPAVNSVVHRRYESALDESRRDTNGGQFWGVPTLIKSSEPTAGDPHDLSTVVLKRLGRVAGSDSVVVRRLRKAGLIPVGKSTAPEMGLVSTTESRAYGSTRNPWRKDLTSGGSSGGASAAVASGMVAIAHGGDGGGSIRMPASFCHLVGLKPSVGLISNGPGANTRWDHSVPAVVTRTVRDTAAVVDAISGGEPGDRGRPQSRPGGLSEALRQDAPRLRIGFVAHGPDHAVPVEPIVREAVLETAQLLASLGHEVEQAHPDAMFDPQFIPTFFDALSVTVAQAIDDLVGYVGHELAPEDLDPITRFWEKRGRELSGLDLASALSWLGGYRHRMAGWWSSGFDLLLSPVFSTPPPMLGWPWEETDGIAKSVNVLTFTAPFNSTGQPAISVPARLAADTAPIGIQMAAAYAREDHLIAVAGQLEQARPWAHLHPPLDGVGGVVRPDAAVRTGAV